MSLCAVIDIADESVFILDSISEGRVRPATLGVVALIFEAGAVDVIDLVRSKIEWAEERADSAGITVYIQFVVAVEIVKACQAMLPSVGRGHSEFHATEKVV